MSKFLIFGILLILIPALIFMFKGWGNQKQHILSPSIAPEPSVKTVSEVPFFTSDLDKRQFTLDSSSFMYGNGNVAEIPYPEEVAQMPEDSLELIRCTLNIHTSPNGYNYYDPFVSKTFDLQTQDQTFQKILSLSQKDAGDKFEIWSFQYCNMENGDMIAHYQKTAKDFKDENPKPDTFLLISEDNIKKVSADIGTPHYFSCSEPLQFTTEKILYYECGGGDITRWNSIYKINFNNLTAKKIIDCHQGEGGVDPKTNNTVYPPIVCK